MRKGAGIMKELKDYIRSIPDFPKEGIIFRDVTTVIQDPDGFKLAVDGLEELVKDVDFDMVVAAEARGFIFGATLAYNNHKGLALVRKKGKLPFETVGTSYDLEYGSASIEMHKDSLKPGDKVVLVDDLIATGGTLEASVKLIESLGAEVVKIVCVMNLPALKGAEKLAKYNVGTLVSFDGE